VITKDALGIVWMSGSEASLADAEKPGMVFFGYWSVGDLPDVDETGFLGLWPQGTIECRVRKWAEHQSVGVDFLVHSWPDARDWSHLLTIVLKRFIDLGALVAWCGGELSSPSVSSLNPAQSDGLVYAGFSSEAGLICLSGLDEELVYLDDTQLGILWKTVFPGLPSGGSRPGALAP
jgi:hypothetical protein